MEIVMLIEIESKEMKGIIRNSECTLEKYSEAYQIWKQNGCGFTE